MDFSNKLEIKYTFNEKSNYLDAFIRNRCEKEILTMVRSLADMFDVRLMVYTEPTEMADGYREIWSIAGEDARCISVIINMTMQILTRPTLSIGGQNRMQRTGEDEREMQREVALFRRELKLKAHGVPTRLVSLLSSSPRFCKYKSNFFESIKGCLKVRKMTLRELNDRNRSRSGQLEVKREQFNQFILRSDELPPLKDQNAIIEIISPVLTDARYRWKGIYNKSGAMIDFYMQDDEFKKQMVDDKIAFSSGMCIECVLEISRKLSELGEIIHAGYVVTTVVKTRFGKIEVITPQGKKHLRKQQAEREQLTLDLFM